MSKTEVKTKTPPNNNKDEKTKKPSTVSKVPDYYLLEQNNLQNIIGCIEAVVPNKYIKQTLYTALNDNIKAFNPNVD